MDQGGQDRDRKVGIRAFKEKEAVAFICGASDSERLNSNLAIYVFWKANGQPSKFTIYVSCVRYVFSHNAKLQISSQYCAEYFDVFSVDFVFAFPPGPVRKTEQIGAPCSC